jgi:hypothetical protein
VLHHKFNYLGEFRKILDAAKDCCELIKFTIRLRGKAIAFVAKEYGMTVGELIKKHPGLGKLLNYTSDEDTDNKGKLIELMKKVCNEECPESEESPNSGAFMPGRGPQSGQMPTPSQGATSGILGILQRAATAPFLLFPGTLPPNPYTPKSWFDGPDA